MPGHRRGLALGFDKAGAPRPPAAATMFVGGLRERAAEAAPPGVTLGLKTHNRYEVNVLNTARDALVRADDIGSDHVMSHLGAYRMTIKRTTSWHR